jgi:CBS domain-containing protein
MLTKDLINPSIPQLHPQDSVGKALQLMNDFRLSHMAVVEENLLLGIISEDELLDEADEETKLTQISHHLLDARVKGGDYFLIAANKCIEFDTHLVGVVNEEGAFLGSVTSWDLFKNLSEHVGVGYPGSIIVLSIDRVNYSISEISRIVESNDATILHLNTQSHPDTSVLTVTIQINKQEANSILATFERFNYQVLYNHGVETFENDIESNFKHLMNYLNI